MKRKRKNMAKRETAEKEEANYFMSQVEDVASEGYRSPASIFFSNRWSSNRFFLC